MTRRLTNVTPTAPRPGLRSGGPSIHDGCSSGLASRGRSAPTRRRLRVGLLAALLAAPFGVPFAPSTASFAAPLVADDDLAPARDASAKSDAKPRDQEKPATEPSSAKVADKATEKPRTAEDEAREAAKKEVEAMNLELQKLTVEYQLAQQRQKNQLVQSELAKQEIATKAGLEQAKLEEQLAAMKNEVARLSAELAVEKARQQKATAATEARLDDQSLASKVASAELERQLEKGKLEAQRLQTENLVRQEELKRAQMEAAAAKQALDSELYAIKSKLEVRSTQDQASAKVTAPVQHPLDPVDGKALRISDRRIALDGPIFSGTADFVCDRIDYFNNKSTTEPIFIVIDSSPGGSVMEGYRIVNAIRNSPAPVHVLVKSFAASMAAVITTLAPHSYALPNAIILHHQMSSGMNGNLTQQKEQLENSLEWAKRLAEPVAAKMGITYDELVKQMYTHNSNGDWQEFGDKAKGLKWVDTIVEEIREEGFRDQPGGTRGSLPFWMDNMQTDAKGKPFVKLPPLMPFDHYFIYDPQEFFR
ncbi:MAG: ATP-dependent Clp protease proteolytic subunit [Phycisphaerales bacterium]